MKEHAKDVKMHQFNGAVKMMAKYSVLVLEQIKLKAVNLAQTQLWLYNTTILIKNENDVCNERYLRRYPWL